MLLIAIKLTKKQTGTIILSYFKSINLIFSSFSLKLKQFSKLNSLGQKTTATIILLI